MHPKVYYYVQKTIVWFLILSQINLVHVLPLFLNISFNIILQFAFQFT
jgi:hypothetical protein